MLVTVPSPDPALSSCAGRPSDRLVVTPREPLVPFGGSTELYCSLACPGGKAEWSGLDIALGTISSFSTHSILHIRHATVAMEGTKFCQGKCHGEEYQKTVILKVYGECSPARPSLRPSTALDLQGSPFPPELCCAAKNHP